MSKAKSGDATRIDALLSWLQQREDEMAALLAELVAIPTENPPGRIIAPAPIFSKTDCGEWVLNASVWRPAS